MKKKPRIITAPEDAFIRRNYRQCGARFVADALGLSPQQVRSRAHYVGIRQRKPVLGRPFSHGFDARRGGGTIKRVEIK